MSNRTRLLAAVALLIVAAAALGPLIGVSSADPPRIVADFGYYGSDSFGRCGEIDIFPASGGSVPTPFVTDVTPFHSSASFATFCIQGNQAFEEGQPYWVDVSTSLDNGLNIPLAPKAAHMFHLWNSKALPGYNYGAGPQTGWERPGGVTTNIGDAVEFQALLWRLQGFAFLPYANTLQQQQWMTIANAYSGGIGDVRVMRMYKNWSASAGFSGPVQDMLIELSPEPATFGFLALGLVGALPFLRRRRRA